MHEATRLAYVAGLFDGEGHIRIQRQHFRDRRSPSHCVRVSVSNTDRSVIEFLHDTFGGYIVVVNNEARCRKAHWRTCWSWELTSTGAANFLSMIQPYVRIKQRQVQLALEFQDQKNADGCRGTGRGLTAAIVQRRDQTKQQMSALNRGVPA